MLNAVLEIARGLAALWVFVYHIRFALEASLLRRLADAGFLGVPLFFVISGYCMMASSSGVMAKGQPATLFLKRRLRRIFPPFWFSIAVALAMPFVIAILYGVTGGNFHWPRPNWVSFSFGDWVALATLTKGLLWTGPNHKPYAPVNAVYWSLAIEVQFYLVMTLALAFRRWFYQILWAVTVICCGIWIWRGPFFSGLFGEYWPMFALGLGLFTLLNRGIRPGRLFGNRTQTASLIACALLLAGSLALVMFFPDERVQRQTLFALLCTGVLWLASGFEPAVPKNALATRAMVGLGKMSYSVYLLHLYTVSLGAAVVVCLYPHETVLALPLRMVAALVFCWVFYEVCEKRFAINRKRPPAPVPLPVPAPVESPEQIAVG